MKENNIFKEKLYHHTMPVREELWDAIEAQLPPKKEQRIFPVFWLILFTSTFLGGALMLGLFNRDASTVETKDILAVPGTRPSDTDLSVSSNNPSIVADDASKTETTDHNPVTKDATEVTGKETVSTTPEHYKNSLNSTTPASKNSRNASTKALKGKSAVSLDSGHSVNLPSNESNSPSILNQSSLLPADALQLRTTRDDYATSLIPLTDVYITGTSDLFVIHPAVKPDPNCYKFTSSGGQIVYSVDGYIGPGISPKSFTANAAESSAYITAREATESNQYAWSTGVRFNVHHRSGLTGRIGLSYTQAGDIFDYTDSLATQSTTRIDSFFAADGTFLYAETSQVLILGTLIKKIHNTYRYLDIPLIIGYEMPMGRSNLMFNIGPVLNLKSTHEGQILDPMLHPRPITDGEPGAIDVYKTSLGISLYIGAGVLFPISDALSGLVEPSFTYRFNPVTVDNYPISEHRHYAGLNVGLRYHIQ